MTYSDTKTTWRGQSGASYEYEIHPIGTAFRPVPGNYIFAIYTVLTGWVPVYIGQTENLNERFESHHKAPCIKRQRATHIHVHANSQDWARLAEETDLIRRWGPPCNG